MDFLTTISELVKHFWGAWLMLLFLGASAWALWPSKKRQAYMDEASRIPFEEDKSGQGQHAARMGG